MALYIYPPTPVSVSVPPLEFVYDGLNTQVEQDTVNPANNRALPTLATFVKDGIQTIVNEDTVTPANNEPLPVKLTGVTGDVIINAGDLNVSTSSLNDSMAIGDGVTGTLANVRQNAGTLLNEMKVRDDDANTTLDAIEIAVGDVETAVTNSAIPKQAAYSPFVATEAVVIGAIGASGDLEVIEMNNSSELKVNDASGNSLLTAIDVSTAAIQTSVQLLDNSANVDGNPAGTAGIMVGGKDPSGDFQQLQTTTAGELLVSFGSAGFATESTLSALNNKVVQDYGPAGSAIRTAAQIGNAVGVADFGVGADSSQTLRVSANLKRAGNELSYNGGTPDANTLRVAAQVQVNGNSVDTGLGGANATTTLRTASVIQDNSGNPVASENIVGAATISGRALNTVAAAIGWDGVGHAQLRLSSALTGNRLLVEGREALKQYTDTTNTSIANTGVTSISGPGNVARVKVLALDTNTVNLRVRVNADPSASAGFQLQPGREVSWDVNATTVRLIAESTATGQGAFVSFEYY